MTRRTAPFWPFACLLLLLARPGLASGADVLGSVLDLTEAEFFDAGRAVLSPRESVLLDLDFVGVAVSAPREIETGRHDELPLIMATRYDGRRDWAVPLAYNCILVATNLQDGSVRFANALASAKELHSRAPRESMPRDPRPPDAELEGEGAQLTAIEAAGRLGIPWDTGAWSLGVLYYDWPSNTVVVNLHGDGAAATASARTIDPPPGVSGLPVYTRLPRTPPYPEKGVSFTVEAPVKDGRNQLTVFGAFTLPVRPHHLPARPVAHRLPDGSKASVAAVVPVTLAVLGLDWVVPLRFDWAVPVYGESLVVGGPARGSFAIDALAPHESLVPGSYVAYLVMDGRIFGPQGFEVPGTR